jgi:hypothetical protein
VIEGASTRIMPGQAGPVMVGLSAAKARKTKVTVDRFAADTGINVDADHIAAQP